MHNSDSVGNGHARSLQRLGSIAYINSLPIDWGLLSGAVECPVEMHSDVPARLNEQMLSGEVTAGPVSAIWYAQHPEKFYLLPDLSISSQSGVQSVLLFSRYPLPAMPGRPIAVTSEGRTTPALLEILCRRRYGFTPQFTTDCGLAQGRLIIGDRALIESEEARRAGWVVTDLAEEWRAWTGLGFVFALWVVRRKEADTEPALVARVWQAIQESRRWGAGHRDEILHEASLRTGLSNERLQSYFSALSYDFGEELREAFRRYRAYAAECGLVSGAPEPVFFDVAEVAA